MKHLRLLHEVWLTGAIAGTLSLVAIQPVRADVEHITAVRLNPIEGGIEVVLETASGNAPQVFATRFGETFVADVVNTQLRLPEGDRFRQDDPTSDIASVVVAPLDTNSVRVTVVGAAGVPTGQIVQGDRGLVLSLSTPPADAPTALTPDPITPNQPADSLEPPETASPEVPSSDTADPGVPGQSEEPDQTVTPSTDTPITDTPITDTSIQITVTADRTPEDIQDVPASITVLTEQEIEDADVTSLEDISRNTPNFAVFPAGGNRNFTFYSVRGLSNSNFASRDAVSFYIDDVPYDYGGFLDLDLIDLERVEVLRGPQNTLYGRSSLAGVVNIYTHRPTNDFEFNGLAGYGSYNDLDLRASVSGPLVEDELFFRLSGGYESRDGYIDNNFLDEDASDQSGGNGRAQLLWNPSDDLEIAFNAAFDDYRDGGWPLVPIDSDPFEIEQDYEGFNDLTSNSQSLRVAYTNPEFRLTSITARRFSHQNAAIDIDGTPLDGGRVTNDFDSTVWSQEFRLQAPEDAELLQWIVGGYFESRDFNTENDGLNFGADAPTLFGSAGIPDSSLLRSASASQTTYAVFGQASYQVTTALTLTAGLRYETTTSTLEDFERVFSIPGFPDQTLAAFDDVEENSDAWLPRFVAEYRLNPNLLAYGTIARGYRPGGVNFRPDNNTTLTFESERSWNYEAGFRSSWLDDRLGVNLALFHNPIDNYQVISVDEFDVPVAITNADVNINGLELEVRATPLDGLDLIAGLGLIEAEFKNFTDSATGASFDGNRPPFAPDLTYNLAVQYRAPIGIFARVELQGLGKTYFDEANATEQDSFAVVNARIGYEIDGYGFYLFGNNIFDTRYLTNVLGTRGSYGEPATYGLQVRVQL